MSSASFDAGPVVERIVVLPVRMHFDPLGPGKRKTPLAKTDCVKVDATVLGRSCSIHWPIAGDYSVALTSGRLLGSKARRAWRMHPYDLAQVRRLTGWTKWRPPPKP